MTFINLHNFLANLISFAILLDPTISEEDIISTVPVHRIAVEALWQPTLDICQDPVHGGLHIRASAESHITDEAWTELRAKFRNFHHILLNHKRSLVNKTCPNTVAIIRQHNLLEFIMTNRTVTNSQTLAIRIYQIVTEMSHIFSILQSAGSRICCLEDRVVYYRLRNQILPDVYNMISGHILNWPLRNCVHELRTLFHDVLTCDHVRTLILLVYKYGIEQSELIMQLTTP